MAVDYEQYRKSPLAEQQAILNQVRGRLETSLQLNPNLVNTDRFFRDVYLLNRTGFFGLELKTKTQQKAADPKIRGEYVNRLKNQDATSDSEEVLATLAAGRIFEYHREEPFRIVFEKLEAKHEQLIAEEERQRAEARRRTEERRKAEETRRAEEKRRAEEARKAEETRRKSKTTWPPESNTGKSPEWIQAQEKIAKLWEQKSQTLPQGLSRETPAADIAYFETGFNLLKNEISSASPPGGLRLRAMIEYLIPRIWRQPGILERFIKQMTPPPNAARPINLAGLDTLSKAFYIPLSLQELTQPLNKKQSKQIDSVYRAFTKSMHPDVAKWPDMNENLQNYVTTIYKSFTSNWDRVRELVVGSK